MHSTATNRQNDTIVIYKRCGWERRVMGVLAMGVALVTGAHGASSSVDLTQQSTTNGMNREATYNLGATGMRGWIDGKPASYFDGLQGRSTQLSRQILVTHVGKKSPADGVMQVDDVILGVNGKPFSDDARKSFAFAIQEAEKESNKGVLNLTRWRAGKTASVQLKLHVMGTYSATAPYDCPKSKLILEEACKVLENEPLNDNWCGAINGLALLASGNPAYLPKVREYARRLAPASLDLRKSNSQSAWEIGYRNMFLCEYYLLTGDKKVLHGITEYTLSLATGQGMYGTFGHGYSELTADGQPHGAIPPYGPVNMAGLPANLGIIMGKLCGVKDPEVDTAIARASGFFGYYVDKGAIPYGEHEPWPYHENNGKNSLTALLFALQWNHSPEARFFARMATAGYACRECGHTGQGFSYLWSALGANVGGPVAAAAFFKEASWHFDLVRRCDGSFTYDGAEQFGPGKTDDNTYYGKSGYNGLSPAATYVLTYAMPLKKLCITGKDANPDNWLSQKEVDETIASGRFDLDRTGKTAKELVAAFSDWSPVVRGWAADELARRPEAQSMAPKLIDLAEGKDVHVSQGACEALGILKPKRALSALVRLLSHDDRWVRFKAAEAIKKMGGDTASDLPDILKAIALTAEPLSPINWADPVQLTHGQLAAAVFSGALNGALKEASPKLRYPAIQIIARNPDGMARATLGGYFSNELTEKDVQILAPDLLAAVKVRCPADTMFGAEIRMGAFKALTKFHYKEGIEAGLVFAQTQGGHGSQIRTALIMKELESYGSAARDVVPQLKELQIALIEEANAGLFPKGEINELRTNAVSAAIRSIQSARDQPKLKTIVPGGK
ncbi:MAG: hypothetical protein RLZZ282_1153 [Verrucomicrobiota bacterium]